MSRADPRVSVVVLTHDRAVELARTLTQLQALPERPAIVVVDNASSDGTAELVRRRFPDVVLVRSDTNAGAAGRNLGVSAVASPYVAFCDDDTWWHPGSLARAADLLDAYPAVGVLSARVLVGPDDALDPACERMRDGPLDSGGLPGTALIAFMAGAAVMRVAAFRDVGGYEPRFFLGAEEALLALDLAARGWRLVYVDDVVTHHHPSNARDAGTRDVVALRNRLWLPWLRLPARVALRETRNVLREARRSGLAGAALAQALAGASWVARRRRVVPPAVVAMYERVFHGDARRVRSPSRGRDARAGERFDAR